VRLAASSKTRLSEFLVTNSAANFGCRRFDERWFKLRSGRIASRYDLTTNDNPNEFLFCVASFRGSLPVSWSKGESIGGFFGELQDHRLCRPLRFLRLARPQFERTCGRLIVMCWSSSQPKRGKSRVDVFLPCKPFHGCILIVDVARGYARLGASQSIVGADDKVPLLKNYCNV